MFLSLDIEIFEGSTLPRVFAPETLKGNAQPHRAAGFDKVKTRAFDSRPGGAGFGTEGNQDGSTGLFQSRVRNAAECDQPCVCYLCFDVKRR